MASILQDEAIDRLPVLELSDSLDLFLEPALAHMPEKRLQAVGKLAVQGVLGGQSPLVTQMARGVAREDETDWVGSPLFSGKIQRTLTRMASSAVFCGELLRDLMLSTGFSAQYGADRVVPAKRWLPGANRDGVQRHMAAA